MLKNRSDTCGGIVCRIRVNHRGKGGVDNNVGNNSYGKSDARQWIRRAQHANATDDRDDESSKSRRRRRLRPVVSDPPKARRREQKQLTETLEERDGSFVTTVADSHLSSSPSFEEEYQVDGDDQEELEEELCWGGRLPLFFVRMWATSTPLLLPSSMNIGEEKRGGKSSAAATCAATSTTATTTVHVRRHSRDALHHSHHSQLTAATAATSASTSSEFSLLSKSSNAQIGGFVVLTSHDEESLSPVSCPDQSSCDDYYCNLQEVEDEDDDDSAAGSCWRGTQQPPLLFSKLVRIFSFPRPPPLLFHPTIIQEYDNEENTQQQEGEEEEEEVDQVSLLTSLADQCENDCDYRTAISHIEACLALVDNSKQQANLLHRLGDLHCKSGQYGRSLDACLQSLCAYDELLQDLDIEFLEDETQPVAYHRHKQERDQLETQASRVLLSTGRVHLARKECDAALRCYRECVHRLPTHSSGDTKHIFAMACIGAGRVLQSQGRHRAARRRYSRALEVQLGRGGRQRLGSILTTDSTVADHRDDDSSGNAPAYPSSPTPSVKSYAVATELLSSSSSTKLASEAVVPLVDVAETLVRLGSLHEDVGECDSALRCYTLALELYHFHDNDGNDDDNMDDTYHSSSSSSASSMHLEEVLRTVLASTNASRVLVRLGRYDEAEHCYESALDILHRSIAAASSSGAADDHHQQHCLLVLRRKEASVAHRLGHLCAAQSRHDRTRRAYKRSLRALLAMLRQPPPLEEDVDDGNHDDFCCDEDDGDGFFLNFSGRTAITMATANVHHAIAMSYEATFQTDRALKYYGKAVRMLKDVVKSAKKQSDSAAAAASVGQILLHIGELERYAVEKTEKRRQHRQHQQHQHHR